MVKMIIMAMRKTSVVLIAWGMTKFLVARLLFFPGPGMACPPGGLDPTMPQGGVPHNRVLPSGV